MKKIMSIELQGKVFPIENSAYKKLEAYLKSIRQHFSTYSDSHEIISDLELRIAEKFTEKLKPRKKTSLAKQDIEKLVKEMGSVEDISLESTADDEESEKKAVHKKINKKSKVSQSSKRFFRNPDEALLGGVASGIAAYFNIDPIFIRLLFIITIGIGGYSLLLYVVLWMLMPEAKTATEILQMRGGNLTISSIEKTVKKNLEKVELNKKVKKGSQFIFHFGDNLKNIIVFLLKFLMRTFGLILSLTALTSIIVTFFGLFIFVFNFDNPYLDPAVAQVTNVISFPDLLILASSLFFIVAIPLVELFLAGWSLLRNKNYFNWISTMILFSLWLSAMGVSFFLSLKLTHPVNAEIDKIIQEREAIVAQSTFEQSYNFRNFNTIEVKGYAQVNIKQGPFEVKAVGSQEVVEALEIKQEDNKLVIEDMFPHLEVWSIKTDSNEERPCWFSCPQQTATIEITLPNLAELELKDKTEVNIDEAFDFGASLKVDLSNKSRARMAINGTDLKVIAKDKTYLFVNGEINSLDILLRDSAQANFGDSEIVDVKADVGDSSSLSLPAVKNLQHQAADLENIYFAQEPEIIEVNLD